MYYAHLQAIDVKTYEVLSQTNSEKHTVVILTDSCTLGQKCILHCTASEYGFLCRHIMQCMCIDYQHGHICKHMHKVWFATESLNLFHHK